MQAHRPPLARRSRYAARTERASIADGPVKLEIPMAWSLSVSPLGGRPQLIGYLSCRTGTRPLLQVDGEVLLGKATSVWSPWHFGHHIASRIGKLLTGSPVTISAVPDGLLHLQ